MIKKSWILASLLGAAAMTMACGDDGKKEEKPQPQTALYFLWPGSTGLGLSQDAQNQVLWNGSLEKGDSASVSVVVTAKIEETGAAANVGDLTVHAQLSDADCEVFTLQDGACGADIAIVNGAPNSFVVNAIAESPKNGANAVPSRLVITSDANHPAKPITLSLVSTAKTGPIDEPVDVDYKITLEYEGAFELDGYANVYPYAGKTCADLGITTGMSAKEVMERIDADKSFIKVSPISVKDDLVFTLTRKEDSVTQYAVVGNAQGNAGTSSLQKVAAYGCVDGMSRDNKEITIALDDVFVDPCETNPYAVGCPCDLDPESCGSTPNVCERSPFAAGCPCALDHELEGCPDYCASFPDAPECNEKPPVVNYSGNYHLTSSFNAWSLLPKNCNAANGCTNVFTVPFTQMLAGDWIEFSLDLLSDPSKKVPEILTKQLLPLLLNAEWLQNLIGKIPNYGEVILALLGNLDDFLETFGLNQIITNALDGLTSQLTWWDNATGAVTILRDLTERFTLSGNLVISASEASADGRIAGINQRYSSVLYNNGGFKWKEQDCFLGERVELLEDGKAICAIDLASLEQDAGIIRGSFTAEYSVPVGADGTVEIWKHNLQLAYAKLIYAAILQTLDKVIPGKPDSYHFKTLGDVAAFYAGMGLAALYNKDLAEGETAIPEEATGCGAVGAALVGFINRFLAKNEKLGSLAAIVQSFLQPQFVADLCLKGVGALDGFIDKQLSNNQYLNVQSDKVMFSTDPATPCKVHYRVDSKGNPINVSYYGTDDYKWNSSAQDNRCVWKIEIDRGEDGDGNKLEPLTAEGKFWAWR